MTGTWRIEDLIPHRENMLLIDRVVKVDKAVAVTESVVTPRWPLVGRDGANPLVMVELAAQTAGICLGWNRMKGHPEKTGSPGGWIVGIKLAEFYVAAIPLNTCLTTRVSTELAVENYMEFAATVVIGDSDAAQIRLQVLEAEKTSFAGVRD
jgi:predicted hotdog family 3-hydroxylacyl-ACP dehydratase